MDLAGSKEGLSLHNVHFLVNLGLQKYSNIPLVPPKFFGPPAMAPAAVYLYRVFFLTGTPLKVLSVFR